MRRASSARGSANSLGSAGKAESWPAPHGGYPSDRKRSFGQRMKKSASDGGVRMRKALTSPFLMLKKTFSGRSQSRKRAPTPTRDLSADFERESEASAREDGEEALKQCLSTSVEFEPPSPQPTPSLWQRLVDWILLLLCRFVPALRETTPAIAARRRSTRTLPAVEPEPTELPEERTPSLAGIPAEHVAGVRDLQKRLAPFIKEEGEAALSEPLMLLRFLFARECDPQKAAAMWRATHAWRRLHVPRALAELGSFENPDHKPLDDAPRRGEWTWRRSAVADVKTVRGRIAQNAGTSSIHRDVLADDGGVTTVSRTGRLDMAGLAREHALDPVLMFQASMLEDVLQTVRAASQREKRLVRAHAIFDLDGLSVIATLRHVRKFGPPAAAVAQRYFPEVNASTTVINSPRGVETLWGIVSLWLDQAMRDKVSFRGRHFAKALRDHARLDADAVKRLPAALGGEASNDLLMPCPPFSKHDRADLDACGEPAFVHEVPLEATFM